MAFIWKLSIFWNMNNISVCWDRKMNLKDLTIIGFYSYMLDWKMFMGGCICIINRIVAIFFTFKCAFNFRKYSDYWPCYKLLVLCETSIIHFKAICFLKWLIWVHTIKDNTALWKNCTRIKIVEHAKQC